ncbi:MAG: class I SAM-dependent methyltransferase [Bryobacter sp.]|nr:class I SAM-dependent methyltransferase [Bryobacter sp. CoA8 C33]
MSVYTLKDSPYSSHQRLLALLDPARDGRRLLDVGCGNGFLSRLLAAKGFSVTGIEHSLGFDGPPPAIVHDLELPLPSLPGPFDVIVIGDVLEHLRQPDTLLRQLLPHLAPGGKILASLPNSGNLYFRLHILLGSFPEHDKGLFDRTHLHFWMLRNWRNLFDRSGYSFSLADVTGIPVGLAIPALSWLEALCYHLARAWKTLLAYQFLVVANRKSSS